MDKKAAKDKKTLKRILKDYQRLITTLKDQLEKDITP